MMNNLKKERKEGADVNQSIKTKGYTISMILILDSLCEY